MIERFIRNPKDADTLPVGTKIIDDDSAEYVKVIGGWKCRDKDCAMKDRKFRSEEFYYPLEITKLPETS